MCKPPVMLYIFNTAARNSLLLPSIQPVQRGPGGRLLLIALGAALIPKWSRKDPEKGNTFEFLTRKSRGGARAQAARDRF